MARAKPTYYILHGEDEFGQTEFVQTLRKRMGDPATAELNTTLFDGHTASLSEIQETCEAFPFLADRRLVIVENWFMAHRGRRKADKAQVEQMVAYLPQLPDWARLVLVERAALKDTHAALKHARGDERGYEKQFNLPRDATQWLRRRAANYEVEIEGRALAALAGLVGTDLRRADSELAKLADYVNGERPITEADIALLMAYVPTDNIFLMVDSLIAHDSRTAMRQMRDQLEGGSHEPLQVLGMIVRQFRLLILAREYLDNAGRPEDLAKALKQHPYVAKKLAAQARNFALPDLEKIYHYLLDMDLAIKTGRIESRLALDVLVAQLAS